MKTMLITIGVFLFSILLWYVRSYKIQKRVNNRGAQSGESASLPKVYHPKTNTFNDLRTMAFAVTPEQLHLSFPQDQTNVYGVIVDWGIDTSTATIIAYQTGDASMYLSSGGGIIGGAQHANVSTAAKKLVTLAQGFLNRTEKSSSHPLPQQDEVRFNLLTNRGTFAAQEILQNFDNGSSPWISLFNQANNVLTELRMVTKKKN